MVGEAMVKYVWLGGITVTRVVGAVPVMVVLGDVVAVPPEMLALGFVPDAPSLTQVVIRVITDELVAVAVVRINSPV